MNNQSTMNKILIIYYFLMLMVPIYGQEEFSLEQAINFGIENSRNVQMKKMDMVAADADIKDVRSIGMPKLSGNVNYQYYFNVPAQPIADFITPSVYDVLFDEAVLERRDLGPPEISEISFFQPHNLSAGLEASVIVFDGSYLVGLKAAKLYKELVAKELDATEDEIKANITKAYMAVLIAEENKAVLENNIKTVVESLEDVRALYKEGFAESLDVDRLILSSNQLNTELEKILGLISISKNLLKFHMGYDINKDIKLIENLENIVGNYNLAEIDLKNEIDISERAEYDVMMTGQELNKLDLKRYKAGYLPSVRAFANAQGSLQRSNLFDNDEAGWIPQTAVGMGISIPIYDGGEKSAKIQKAKVNIDKTEMQIAEFKHTVTLQVQNARLAIINAQKTVANTKEALTINERIYNKAQIKFREGVGSSVEVTQAEASLYQAQGAYISALYDLVTAKADLDIAQGKL